MNATRRLAALPRLGAIAAALILAGCSVTPTLVSQDEVKNRISADTAQMYADQAPIDAPVSLDEALARALKYNLDYRLKKMESALAFGLADYSRYDMLPQLLATAGYRARNNDSGGTSIGIEHVANTRGLNPTAAQMCASAALVTWLCDTYGIPTDRQHILGHAEADGRTTHAACPNAVWDWAYYMDMIRTRTCYEPASITPSTGLALGLGRSRALSDDADDPDAYGIATDEPVEDEAMAQGLRYARGLATETPDYPGASRFVPAVAGNFRRGRRRGRSRGGRRARPRGRHVRRRQHHQRLVVARRRRRLMVAKRCCGVPCPSCPR